MGDTLFGKGRSEDKRRLAELRERVETKRAEDKKREEEAKEVAKLRRSLAKQKIKDHTNGSDLDSPMSNAGTEGDPQSPKKILDSSSLDRKKYPNSPKKENDENNTVSPEKVAPKAVEDDTSLAFQGSVVGGDSWAERLFGMCMCCDPANTSPVQTVVPVKNDHDT